MIAHPTQSAVELSLHAIDRGVERLLPRWQRKNLGLGFATWLLQEAIEAWHFGTDCAPPHATKRRTDADIYKRWNGCIWAISSATEPPTVTTVMTDQSQPETAMAAAMRRARSTREAPDR